MEEKIPSPPKPVRVVKMSPTGIVCSPYINGLQGSNIPNQKPSNTIKQNSFSFMAAPCVPSGRMVNSGEGNFRTGISSQETCTISGFNEQVKLKAENIVDAPNAVKSLEGLATPVAATSLELEGMFVDKAVLTLPEVVNEVVIMQKGQITEIQKQQLILYDLKTKFKKETENNEEIIQEISSVTHKIYLTQEDTKESSKKCKGLVKDIDVLVSECENLKRKIKEKKEDINKETELYRTYQSKMDNYIEKVKCYENEMTVHQEVQVLQKKVSSLKDRKKEMDDNNESYQSLDGSLKTKVETDLSQTKEQISKCEWQLKEQDKLIVEEKERHKKTEQSIHVLHKKNSAQLTRLKKQLREVNMRSRRWNDQITQLMRTVNDLKQRLEE